ncbi:unnamed protein product [Linum trigynum]|uniref:Uncharacterized protein n=1 Tax=Linum trigynum TaxID=586398 RepID=A0AAV2EKW6_9ROSI
MKNTSRMLIALFLALFLITQNAGVEGRASGSGYHPMSQCKQDRDCGNICSVICSPNTTCKCVENWCSCNLPPSSDEHTQN